MKKTIKKIAQKIPLIGNLAQYIYAQYQKTTFSSSDYWNNRYINGGTSGVGSYNHLAEFKADILNQFVVDKKIETVIEFGFGDGNQLMLADYSNYIGYDISSKAVEVCCRRFSGDAKKRFLLVSEWKNETAELVLSLDVIYHLIESLVFEKYMDNLFMASSKYVVIYASDTDDNKKGQSIHVRHRKFTQWVADNASNWKLINHIPNKYPTEKYDDRGSFADFYFYQKT